ncbi:MAG: hypothetical protein ACE5MG_08680 [Candidatus Methylomirabilales bacterium]
MNEPIMDTLTQRLGRLEREVRWWKFFGSAAVAVVGVVLLLGATHTRVPDEVRARRFVVVDETGKPGVELTPVPSPGLRIFAKDGRTLAELTVDGWSPRLVLRSGNSKGGATMEVLPDSTPILNLVRTDGHGRVWLAVARDGQSTLHLRSGDAPGVAELTVDRRGSPKLALYDKDNRRDAILEMPVDGSPGLTLYKNGKARAMLGLLLDDLPILDLRDREGLPRAALDVGLDGSPNLTFYDREGIDRAELSLGSSGSPRLELGDKEGTLRAALGHIILKTARSSSKEDRPESSLVLFDGDGKVIWKAP